MFRLSVPVDCSESPKMTRRSNLIRRNGTYYARVYYPLDLQAHFRSEDKKISLRTKEEGVAKQRLNLELAKWDAVFEDLRARRVMTADDKADATWQHYEATLERDEEQRQRLPSRADVDAAMAQAIDQAKVVGINTASKLAIMDASLDVMVLNGRRQYEADARRVKLEHLKRHLQEVKSRW